MVAAKYYAINFVEVRNIVNSFEVAGVILIVRRAKAAVNNSKVAESLVKIQLDYAMLPKLIQKMESSKYTILEAHADILTLDQKLDCVDIGKIQTWLTSSDQTRKRAPAVYAELQCCQPTSTAVERSFSMLGKLLRKDQQSLPEMLKNTCPYTIINYNFVISIYFY